MRISLGDVSLWFDVSGPSVIPQADTTAERPVVVAVHGGPGLDHMTVKPALGPLAEDFQMVYFDLRGHGRSDHSSAEFWNMPTWADDLRRLCDALGLDKPLVLGSSFGGNVALTYAGLFPGHPGGVILANTTGGRSRTHTNSRPALRACSALDRIMSRMGTLPQPLVRLPVPAQGPGVGGGVPAQFVDARRHAGT
ncbi:MAG TPA: alpha/beta hydrolase [Streptosporangiaceae bacterium]|nr:alpha/beta hydrolase [Streptosporangiaceae bacterium]